MPQLRQLSQRRPSSTNALLAVVCLAQFMVILDVSIVNIALPSIRDGLHFSTTGLQWVVNAYTLTFAGLLMLGGRAADLLGRRRVFLAGTAMFTLSSVACAVAELPGAADRRARRAGHRRRGHVAGDAGDHHQHAARRAASATAAWRCGARWARSAAPRARCSAAFSPRAWAGRRSSPSTSRSGAIVIVLGLRAIPDIAPISGPRHFDALGATLITAALITGHVRDRADRHAGLGLARRADPDRRRHRCCWPRSPTSRRGWPGRRSCRCRSSAGAGCAPPTRSCC